MLVISAILKILGHSVIEMPKRYAKLEWRHIVMTSNTTREMWKLFERAAPKVKVRQTDVRVREIFTRALADPKWLKGLVARDGIEPPTPAFSGPLTESPKWFEINGCH